MLDVAVAAALGAAVGVASGLLPGFHVNNVALLLLAGTAGAPPLAAAAFLVGVATAHTFVNIVPSTFYGAPDEDAGLVLLPAHAMLREGRALEAVSLSALASFGALLVAVGLAFPFMLLLGPPLHGYERLRPWLPAVLLGLAAFLVWDDRGPARGVRARAVRAALCVSVFGLAGVLGLVALPLPMRSPLGLPGSALFPLLGGLFAAPTLVAGLGAAAPRAPNLPERGPLGRADAGPLAGSVLAGCVSGALTGFLPGVTGSAATVLALAVRGRSTPRDAVVALSAVNTAGLVFTLAVLFAVGRERSGVAGATARLLPGAEGFAPAWFSLVGAMLVAGALAYGATVAVGRAFLRVARAPQRPLALLVLALLAVAVVAWTGGHGLLVAAAASLVGWLPVAARVRRGHLMGCLLVPTLLRLWGAA